MKLHVNGSLRRGDAGHKAGVAIVCHSLLCSMHERRNDCIPPAEKGGTTISVNLIQYLSRATPKKMALKYV
jgi:hypothetical protein